MLSSRRATRPGIPLVLAVLVFGFAASACESDPLLSATNLRIMPNPAQAGDVVTFVFDFTLVPEREYSVLTFIDDAPHFSQTRSEAVDGVLRVPAGDGADLIATYGLGMHTARVEILDVTRGATVETPTAQFELQ